MITITSESRDQRSHQWQCCIIVLDTDGETSLKLRTLYQVLYRVSKKIQGLSKFLKILFSSDFGQK